MEKNLIRWGFLLGLACFALSLGLRGMNALGVIGDVSTKGSPISYMTFFRGAILFFLTCVAAQSYRSAKD